MSQKVFITGLSGFVGSHLARYCLTQRGDVSGVVFSLRAKDELKRIEDIRDRIVLYECNLVQKKAIFEILRKVQPDIIFHLAAQSSPALSWQNPEQTLTTNILSTLNILEAVKELKLGSVIQVAGSSEEYGLVKEDELPVKETNSLRPLSPYGVSKIAQEMLAVQYWQSHQLKTVVTRAFNHTGPGKSSSVVSVFAHQIARIEAGLQDTVMKVGELEVYRDFTDVRDIVKAYWLATEHCDFGEPYNVGSGHPQKIKDILEKLLSFSKKALKIEQGPELMRPVENKSIYCDFSKFQQKTGWRPEINFETTLKDVLEYWRNEVKNQENFK